MPRTESECTTSSGIDDEDVILFPLCEVGVAQDADDVNEEDVKNNEDTGYLTMRQRRQIKLGIRKVLPLNVLIPHVAKTDKNRKWYEALKKVWHHKDPWHAFHLDTFPEKEAIRHRYDPVRHKWRKDHVRIKMEEKPFNRGAMRQCFRLKKLSKFCHSQSWLHASNYVAKRYMESVDRSVYFEDVKLQMDAKLWGEEYNRHHPPKQIDIFQMYIIELVNEPGSPLYHLEHFIEGEYIKYNSNSGFVEDSKQCRLTPQAFSHFTFERSGHELIVVDIQGVGDLYTDPQIHTMDGLMYGDGNLGAKGMALFFHSHECNSICRALSLTPFDLSDAEMTAVVEHHASSPVSDTFIRGMEDHVMSPSQTERRDLTRMLSNPRNRSYSSVSDIGSSLPEEDDSSPPSSDSQYIEKAGVSSQVSVDSGFTTENLNSISSDDCYGYDTSECSSSIPSSSASITKQMEHRMYGLKVAKGIRSASIEAEHLLRNDSDFHLGDSILGEVHHELAKYHEIGRFAEDGDETKIDWESALFHERHAAELGVPEAIVTMSKIYLGLPHDVLVSCVVPVCEENTNRGVEFMIQAANSNDRASILYMAKAYQTGNGLGTFRKKSYAEAVNYYQRALQTQEHDDHGEFDATMSDPNYLLLAAQAELYREGGHGLDKDPSTAGELYTEAADEAMAAMKGRLANKYYMLAEEAWGEIEEVED